MASDGLNEEPVGHGGWSPIQPTRELSVKVLVVKGGFGSSNSSTAPRAAETRAECPAAGVPTPARSRTRSRERQSSTRARLRAVSLIQADVIPTALGWQAAHVLWRPL